MLALVLLAVDDGAVVDVIVKSAASSEIDNLLDGRRRRRTPGYPGLEGQLLFFSSSSFSPICLAARIDVISAAPCGCRTQRERLPARPGAAATESDSSGLTDAPNRFSAYSST